MNRIILAGPAIAALLIAGGAGAEVLGHWPLDEVEGQVTPDASGNGNHATVFGCTLVKGVSGAALQFDGRHSRVRCSGTPSAAPAGALTLEAWVMLEGLDFSGYPAVIRKDGHYALRFGGNTLAFLLWRQGTPVYLTSRKTDWETGRWHHLAATYDGAHMRLFIDGEEDPASPVAHSEPLDASPDNCWIGGVAGLYPFRGVIDEVRIHDRALSPEQVRASHQRGRASLVAEADVAIEPRKVGAGPPTFRKPPREITMVADGFLWIDAEDFEDYGGWLLDTQFVYLMGSGYLIAAGIGAPVQDATVEVDVPEAGAYRLWVRARNWLPQFSPGTFTLLVNGEETRVFGEADTDEWLWEDGGRVDLPAGRVEIALRDLTGQYGRCDAMILTRDMDYAPPATGEEVRQERARLTGLSLEPRFVGEFDVIVVGAGAAGACAALAAARMGARTALIQNRPILGGNASDEMGVPINGAASAHPNARESGIIEEMGRVRARFGYPKMSEPFRLAADQEPNLDVFVNQHVIDALMDGESHIEGVRAINTLTGEFTDYRGRMFIDCTGDGWVGYYAGAEYRLGRESRDEFDESLAPGAPDDITMSGCLMGGRSLSYRAADTGAPAPYTPPPWAPRFPSHEQFGREVRHFVGGEWWLEHPGDFDDIWDAERARDELLRISFGYWDYIKNVWPERARAANYALVEVPILNAKRESRRLVGDYLLNQNDVQGARVFEDRISYGGWPLDIHHPRGIYSGPEGPYDFTPHVPVYTIPYRSLYSVNIDNLLFAGRDMSVTHVALGSVRVQGTLASLGQAAGTAAALAVQRETTPRGIHADHLTDLQQTLVKHDQYIPGIVNEDPLDLARQATVTGSSTARYDEFGRTHVQRDKLHPLNMSRAMMFPVGERTRIEAVHLLLASELDEPAEVTLRLREAEESGDLSSTTDVATVTATVPPRAEGWVEFALGREMGAPFAWVRVGPVEGVSWRLMETAPLGACRAWGGDGNWTVVAGQYYALYTTPDLAVPGDYRPANITNGVTRIVGIATNMWASDPEQPLPQWVELAWDEPQRISAVYLIFDTDMNAAFHTAPLPVQCVRDYELSFHDGARWVAVAEERGNFQRRRVHRFEAVDTSRLRLTVHATNGDKSARVFEVRAYDE